MALLRWLTGLLMAVALFAASGGVVRGDTLFTGNTSLSTPTTIDNFLTFTNAAFSVSLPDGPNPFGLTDLGYFTLNSCSGKNCTEDFGAQDSVTDFVLRIQFTLPDVVGNPVVFGADVFGSLTRSGNSSNSQHGRVTIDFDNTLQHLTFTNGPNHWGTFDFFVEDPAIFDPSAQFGDTRVIRGRISNLVDPEIAPVPEPSSLGLLATVLAGAAFLVRRRFTS